MSIKKNGILQSYLTEDRLPITNLLSDLSKFSLSNISLDTNTGIFTFTPGVLAMSNYPLPLPVAGHKYYGRVDQKVADGTSFGDGRFEYFAGDGTGLNIVFIDFNNAIKDGQWHSQSSIQSFPSIAGSSYYLRTFSVNATATAYRRNHIIVDLTEYFGAGNEPTCEWCDKYLKYDNGQVYITNQAKIYGYELLDYIQSSGTQMINTGIKDFSTMCIDCKFDVITASGNYIYGSTQKNSMMYNGLYNNSVLEFNYLDTDLRFDPKSTIEMNQTLEGSNMHICIKDGVDVIKPIGTPQNTEMYIFGCNGGGRSYTGALRCYYFDIKDGNKLIGMFRPVKRLSDGKVGMLNLVNNSFHSSIVSDQFIAGPSVTKDISMCNNLYEY